MSTPRKPGYNNKSHMKYDRPNDGDPKSVNRVCPICKTIVHQSNITRHVNTHVEVGVKRHAPKVPDDSEKSDDSETPVPKRVTRASASQAPAARASASQAPAARASASQAPAARA